MPLKTTRIYQLPRLLTPSTELVGARFEVDVPLGPVIGGFASKQVTTEEFATMLGGDSGGVKEYVSTENLGGISAGDRFSADASANGLTLVQMLVKYQRPGFTLFNIAGQADRTELVGTQFGAGFKSFTWNTTNPSNVKPISLTIRDVTANTILGSEEENDGVASFSTQAFTVNLGQSRVYLISGVDTQSNTFFETVTISGLFQSFFGYTDANGVLDMPTLLSLGNDVLQSGKARTVVGVTAGIGLYTVYAWPSTGSDDIAQVLQDGVDSIRGAFGPVRYATGVNALGAAVTLGYISSNAPRAFTNSSLAFI
ncbi:MAG: hypothetical protein ACRYFV_13605 [Janthinobacterium lividum]